MKTSRWIASLCLLLFALATDVSAQDEVAKLRPVVVLINALPTEMSLGNLPITRKTRKTLVADMSAELSRRIEREAIAQLEAAGFTVVRAGFSEKQAKAFRHRHYRDWRRLELTPAADQMLLLIASRERAQWVAVLASFTKNMQIHAFGGYDGYGVIKRHQAPSLKHEYLYYNLDIDLVHVSDWQLRNRQASDTCLFELPDAALQGRVTEVGQRISDLLIVSIATHLKAQLAGVLTLPSDAQRCATPPGLVRRTPYYPREHPAPF